MIRKLFSLALLTAAVSAAGVSDTHAAVIPVNPGESIQAAIDSAATNDTIALITGEYDGNIDFGGKDVAIVGIGEASVIRGDGTGPVITITSGEGPGAVVDSVTVTGGSAAEGGGIYIEGSSPTILRNFVLGNIASSRGSGIYVGGSAAPLIANNLVAYNDRIGFGDPHGIQVQGGSPVIVNNTVVRSDSNGIFLSGGAAATVMNNIIGRNGSRGTKDVPRRGRGICNFTTGSTIQFNTFWKNAKSALLQGGRDFRRIRGAERFFESPDLTGNSDRTPKFVRRRLAKSVEDALVSDFDLRDNSRALNAGNPDPSYNNLDGSRNTMGHLGGPLAAP